MYVTKILLVEDDQALREIYGARLIAEGYDVVSASDGEMALAMSIKEQPDLILSDIMMPKVSGFEMVDILKTNPGTRQIKIVVMTALSNESQREKGMALGVDRYLVKSQVSIEDVVDVVHELLDEKQPAALQAPIAKLPNTQSTAGQYQAPGATPPIPLAPQSLAPAAASTMKKTISPLDPNLTLHNQPPQSTVFSEPTQPTTNNVLAPPTSPVTDTSLTPEPEVESPPQLSQPTQSVPPEPDPMTQPPAEPLVKIEDDPLQYKPQ